MTQSPSIDPMTRTAVAGGFVATWSERDPMPPRTGLELHARRFDPSGAPLGDDVLLDRANTTYFLPRVLDTREGLLAAWYANGIVFRPLRADASPSGGAVRVDGVLAAFGVHAEVRGADTLAVTSTAVSDASMSAVLLPGGRWSRRSPGGADAGAARPAAHVRQRPARGADASRGRSSSSVRASAFSRCRSTACRDAARSSRLDDDVPARGPASSPTGAVELTKAPIVLPPGWSADFSLIAHRGGAGARRRGHRELRTSGALSPVADPCQRRVPRCLPYEPL
jgi:hypothetical protein